MRAGTLFIIAFSGMFVSGDAESAFEKITLRRGLRRAEEQKKLVLLDFSPDLGDSEFEGARPYNFPEVRAWMKKHVIAIHADLDWDPLLLLRYRGDYQTQCILLDPDGTEHGRLPFTNQAKEFLERAEAVRTGKGQWESVRAELEKKGGNDPALRMKLARLYEQKQENKAAFAEYIWCLDHGLEHDPSFAKARETELLEQIAALASVHRPAVKALQKRQKAAEAVLLNSDAASGATSRPSAADRARLASDYAAFNEVLGQPARTVTLYLRMLEGDETDREAAGGMILYVVGPLYESKKLKELAASKVDFSALLEIHRRRMEALLQQNASMRVTRGDRREEEIERKAGFIRDFGAKYYEALLATGRSAEAETVSKALIEYSPIARTYAVLIIAAGRAGHSEIAETLASQAMRKLPSGQQFAIKDALEQIKR